MMIWYVGGEDEQTEWIYRGTSPMTATPLRAAIWALGTVLL